MRIPALAMFLAAVGSIHGVCLAADSRLYTPAELRADFAQMYRQLQEAHFNLYAFIGKRELDRQYQAALAQLNEPMTELAAKTRFELFAARVRMGHTRLTSPMPDWQRYRAGAGKGFPLRIRIVSGRSYVSENLSGVAAIKRGDEILELNGIPMRQWLARTERHVSAETLYMAHSLMEYDFAIYVWLELGAAQTFDIVVRDERAGRTRMQIPARSSAEMDAARALQPPALDLETPMREAKMLDGRIAYLRPGPFYNVEAKAEVEEWDVSGFRTFIDHAFETFDRAGAERLIIDLRGNPGGDNLFSDVMVAWVASCPFRFASEFKIKVSAESVAANAERIAHDAAAAGPISQKFADLYAHARLGDIVDFDIPPAYPRPEGRFRGKVYVLIDRQSYSNAVAVAALIQDYRFGIVLGEETSDMATTYGAMEQFPLPHTGLMVGYPKARIVRPNGDLRTRGVTPDIRIRIPIVQDPSDVVLQRAVVIAKGN
jgi:hypothetical protein